MSRLLPVAFRRPPHGGVRGQGCGSPDSGAVAACRSQSCLPFIVHFMLKSGGHGDDFWTMSPFSAQCMARQYSRMRQVTGTPSLRKGGFGPWTFPGRVHHEVLAVGALCTGAGPTLGVRSSAIRGGPPQVQGGRRLAPRTRCKLSSFAWTIHAHVTEHAKSTTTTLI